MKIERPRPAVLRVTLGTYEMATLMAAARWVLEGREGDPTPESLHRLGQVLESYETAMRTGAPPARHPMRPAG